MTLTARQLPLPADPLLLARRLQAEREVAFLWSASAAGPSYLAVRPLEVSRALDPEPDLQVDSSSQLAATPRWIGLLPYEGCRELERRRAGRGPDRRPRPHLCSPRWWRFGAVVRIDEHVTVVGDDDNSVRDLAAQLLTSPDRVQQPVTLELRAREADHLHAERVAAALDLIREGQIYQVNLAHRLQLDVRGQPVDLLARLCVRTRPHYAAALRFGDLQVLSTSPELFLRQTAGVVLTQPIKGTRPRGADARRDAELSRELDVDPKERAELSMIVDVERNDLGRVCRIGSVRLLGPPVVASQGLVWHRRASVVGRLKADVTRAQLLEATLPSGSVTGAPKVRAMEVIAELESTRRGLYTGALGYINHRGELNLAMAIRTLTSRGDQGHYYAGGGIVADSVPAKEVEETVWKSQQLFGRSGGRS